jgi:acyl dehydratase
MTAYLEDLRPGSGYLSAARTIRKQGITAFAGLSGDFSPLHTDDEWGQAQDDQ